MVDATIRRRYEVYEMSEFRCPHCGLERSLPEDPGEEVKARLANLEHMLTHIRKRTPRRRQTRTVALEATAGTQA